MNRNQFLAIPGLMVILAMASCVSSPAVDTPQTGTSDTMLSQTKEPISITPAPAASIQAAPAKPEPVLRERVEEYQVPVLLKETRTFADGLIDQITENTWSPDLSHILSSVTRKPSLPEPSGRTTYTYANKLLVTRSTFGADGTLLNRSNFEYDSEGNLLRETMTDGKGAIQSVSEWVWSEGRKQEWRVLDARGMVLARTSYRYQNGLLSELILSDGAGNTTGKGTHQYDKEGLLTGIRYFSASGTPQERIEYLLENRRVVQEKIFRADGRLERGLLYEYGPEGQILKMTLTDASGRPRESTAYEYTFRTEKRSVFYHE